jgi:C-terminal processing protease CtpA/Prc
MDLDSKSLSEEKGAYKLSANQQIPWIGTIEQKLWGLMVVWSEAKFNFPFFDRIMNINWDSEVQEYVPRVISSKTLDEYYEVLMEFAALLKDSHTSVIPPWRTIFEKFIRPGYDYPPVELQAVEGKFIVARTGGTEEVLKQRICPGLEVLEINELPARKYLQERILRFNSYGTRQAEEAIGLVSVLSGQKDSQVRLKVRDVDSTTREVFLTRNSTDSEGNSFQWRLMQGFTSDSLIESQLINSDIFYVKILSFMTIFGEEKRKMEVVEEFQRAFDSLDLSSIKGIIIDIRHNLGGTSEHSDNIISFLTDEPLKGLSWKSISYVPANRSWGRPTGWIEHAPYTIEPRMGKRYTGPLVVLAGSGTHSAAENFLVPLKYSGRAVIVGEKTAGGSGNQVVAPLPGGGAFRVVSKRDMFPDGQEFVGIGISPDIYIQPTREDLLEVRDPILMKGIEVILNWDTYDTKQRAAT